MNDILQDKEICDQGEKNPEGIEDCKKCNGHGLITREVILFYNCEDCEDGKVTWLDNFFRNRYPNSKKSMQLIHENIYKLVCELKTECMKFGLDVDVNFTKMKDPHSILGRQNVFYKKEI